MVSKTEIEGVRVLMKSLLHMISFMEIEVLEQLIRDSRNSISRAHSWGSMIDPTAYRNALQNGDFEEAVRQEEIAKYVLEIRKILEHYNPDTGGE